MPRSGKSTNGRVRAGLRDGWALVVFTLVLSFLLTVILTVPFLPSAVGPEVRPGFPSPYTIKSPVTTRFVSQILTQKDQEAAAASVEDVYRFDPSITVQARQNLSDTLNLVEAILFDSSFDPEGRERNLMAIEGVAFSTETRALLLSLPEADWPPLEREALRLYDAVTYDSTPRKVRQIQEQHVESIRLELLSRVQPTFSMAKRKFLIDLVGAFIVPNDVVDEVETQRRRDDARSRTPPHYVDVLEGEVIVYDGQIVKGEDIEKMGAVGLLHPEISWPSGAGHGLLMLMLVSCYSLLLHRFREKVRHDVRCLTLIALVIVVAAVGAKLLVPGRVGLAYALPLPTVSILLTLLLNPPVAAGATIILAILAGLLGSNLELAVMGIVGGVVGILGIWKAQRSSTFLFTGFYITLANLAVMGAFRLIPMNLDLPAMATAAIACSIQGFASAALGFATFGVLGTLFGQVTVLQLMELANPHHPLLHRLMQEAPGTYYHSIIVGNLAERAAEVVGADPMLVRVGAYYHDIGKVVRPYFFIDNQAGRTNIHDELPPRSSARIITDHVRDGLALARKHRLPEKVVQFIPQHHGTTLATYFYRRALQEEETVNPDDFRYPGPKPQSREAAILMLADSVEATVRALNQAGKLKDILDSGQEKDGEGPLAKMVAGIIEERMREGQLEESDLTFRDLKLIGQAFVDMLRGIYHPRITYPDLGKAQEVAP